MSQSQSMSKSSSLPPTPSPKPKSPLAHILTSAAHTALKQLPDLLHGQTSRSGHKEQPQGKMRKMDREAKDLFLVLLFLQKQSHHGWWHLKALSSCNQTWSSPSTKKAHFPKSPVRKLATVDHTAKCREDVSMLGHLPIIWEILGLSHRRQKN